MTPFSPPAAPVIRAATRADSDALTSLSQCALNRCCRGFLGDATVDRWIREGLIEGYVRGAAFCARRGWRFVLRYPHKDFGTIRVDFEKDRAAG